MNTPKYFPAQNQNYTYLQTNRSDRFGSLWSTMGADLQSNLGTFRTAPRTLIVTNTAALANLGLPVAFAYPNSLWAIAGTRVFHNANGDPPNSGWIEDASTGAATDYGLNSDLCVFEGNLFATSNDELLRNNSGSAWASVDTLSASVQHPMTSFGVFNRLYYADTSSTVLSLDDSGVISSGSYELDIGDTSYGTISCMVSNSNSVWVGTSGINTSEGEGIGYILQWDGISAGLANFFPFVAGAIAAMCVYENYVYAMDSQGILYKYNGQIFKEIGRLPFVNLDPRSTFVQRNGLIPTRNGTILALVNNRNSGSTSTYQENIPSGVWEWSEDFGFTHKYALGYTPVSSLSTITDFGQNRANSVGALFDTSMVELNASGRKGNLLMGATYFTDASATTNGIFVDDSNNTVVKKGYFVTTWFESDEIEDSWTRLYETYRRLLGANDSLVFKFRTTQEEPVYATITWTSTTTFTTTTDITAYGPTAAGFNGTSGGEVEVQQGTGSAACAHITSIVNNAGTYTVTLDTAITGVTSGTAIARFQKWIKAFPEATGQIKAWCDQNISANVSANNTRIQIKGCLTFTGDGEFYKLALVSSTNESINL